MIRIGIDVGGTNTDAVIMDGSQVIAGVKAGTTADVMTGVVAALRDVLATSGMDAGKVDVVMIGTTHFTNAVVQRRDLVRTLPANSVLGSDASGSGRFADRSAPMSFIWPSMLWLLLGLPLLVSVQIAVFGILLLLFKISQHLLMVSRRRFAVAHPVMQQAVSSQVFR